jgi:predicted RNA-binding Zn-ribbon protein involved in translation (DUF1610 family)
MILEPKSRREARHIAYRCPSCGTAVRGLLGSFAARADLLKLKCPSGDGELSLALSPDRERVRVSVPCLFCGQSHQYTVSRSIILGSEPFLLNCPYTNMDICFIGPKDQVDEEVARSEKDLNQLFEEWGIGSLEELRAATDVDPDTLISDTQIYDIIRFLVRELEADGAIDCPCHSGSYDFDFSPDGIAVFCPQCGAEHIFPTDSVRAAEDFLKCDHLTLLPRED